MANIWLRLYHDMPNDPKFKTIARVAKRPISVVLGVYLHLLVNASEAVDRGTLDGYNIEDLATALDVDSASVGAILDAMQGRVLEGDKVSGWNKRQVNREDSSTERMRQFRKKKVTQRDARVTHGDAVLRNVTADKSREEEIRVNAVSKTTSSHPGAALGAVQTLHPDMAIYEKYPRKEGRGAALEAIRKAVVRLVKGEEPHAPMVKIEAQRFLMRRVLEYERSPVGRQPDKTKIPHPATWFNQKRYDDDQSNWHHMERSNGNESKGDAAYDALRRSIQAGRNQNPAGEDGDTAAGEGGGIGVRGLLGGSDAVRDEVRRDGIEPVVIEASR